MSAGERVETNEDTLRRFESLSEKVASHGILHMDAKMDNVVMHDGSLKFIDLDDLVECPDVHPTLLHMVMMLLCAWATLITTPNGGNRNLTGAFWRRIKGFDETVVRGLMAMPGLDKWGSSIRAHHVGAVYDLTSRQTKFSSSDASALVRSPGGTAELPERTPAPRRAAPLNATARRQESNRTLVGRLTEYAQSTAPLTAAGRTRVHYPTPPQRVQGQPRRTAPRILTARRR